MSLNSVMQVKIPRGGIVVVLVAAIVLLLPTLSSRAWSVPINTLTYREDGLNNQEKFTWIFSWDNTRPSPTDPRTYFPPGANAWVMSVFFPIITDDIVFRAVHHTGPHHGIDRPDSGDFSFTLNNASTLPIRVSEVLFRESRPHPTTIPPDHSDLYTGIYTSGAVLTFFEWTGVHSPEPIPEPTTLLLFGTTMAGLGLTARWRRRRQN